MSPRLRRRTLGLLAGLPLAAGARTEIEAPPALSGRVPPRALQLFPLQAVRLTGGPLHAAQQRNLAYLLALDPQRLLAPFRREAGLPAQAQPYASWESQGLDGHMLGHLLSALALSAAATGNALAGQRLQAVLAELQACQDALDGDALMAGYLGGIPGGAAAWRELAAGTVKVDNFSLNGRWVPWYNVHKTLAGLRDAHQHAGQALAWTLLLRQVDWVERVTARLDDAQFQAMLRAEHGGMAEVLADVHAVSGRVRHARLAQRFVHRALFEPLAAQRDTLTGLHANTQIPKVMGLLRLAQNGGPEAAAQLQAARFFWQTVVEHRSVAIGGNSVKEHFHDAADFGPMLAEVEGPESCNTTNMLKLGAALFEQAPHDDHLAYAERALFNHVLSAQHPRSGGLVYFTPLRAGHYRVYSQAQQAMWCCVGSGIEVHGRHGELVYAQAEDALWVNLFVPSVLQHAGLRVEQQTGFPHDGRVALRLQGLGARRLVLRHPHWVPAGALRVWRNGRALSVDSGPGGRLSLPGPWRDGERVRLQMPLPLRLEPLPAPLHDGRQAHALLAGPIVLAARRPALAGDTPAQHVGDAARMGHIAAGAQAPETSTLTLADPAALLRTLQPGGAPLRFRTRALTSAAGAADPVDLLPFFELHESRYQVYWPQPPGDRPDPAAAEAQALAARTIDSVAPGEQQPEVEHGYAAEGGDTGLNGGRRWRHASGWFGYTLRDPQGQAALLRLELARGDAGRQWTLEVNGQALPLRLQGDAATPFYALDIELPPALRAAAGGRYQLRFIASPGSVAGGLYGLRLLRR